MYNIFLYNKLSVKKFRTNDITKKTKHTKRDIETCYEKRSSNIWVYERN